MHCCLLDAHSAPGSPKPNDTSEPTVTPDIPGQGQKGIVTTAPDRIRKWSPTLLLAGRYPGYLRRSDGMRSFLGSMAVDEVAETSMSYILMRG